MNTQLQTAHDNFIQGMSHISNFWGFPKAMGAIYGAIYLSPTPMTLDELTNLANVTKGAVSTHVRALERLGLIHKQLQIGDRKDYYVAETDFWKVIKGLLREREKSEFDRALRTVGESLELVQTAVNDAPTPAEMELATFYQTRLGAMKSFFDALDSLVAMVISLENLRSSTIQKLFGRS